MDFEGVAPFSFTWTRSQLLFDDSPEIEVPPEESFSVTNINENRVRIFLIHLVDIND